MHKFEMHLHTAENDKVVDIPTEETVRLYHDAGYDGIVVTNHYFSIFDRWFGDELGGGTHREFTDRWLKGYRAALAAGDKLGMVILPGAEIRFDGCINDYLLYGVDERFFYESPRLNKLKNTTELKKYLPDNACVFQAHPFRNNMTVCEPADIFGVETHNGANPEFRNRLAVEYADYYKLARISGSDCHHKAQIAHGGIAFEADVKTPCDLTDVLRSGNYSLIKK